MIRSEWPLLLYPILVLAALATLYVAKRSVLQNRPGRETARPPVVAPVDQTPVQGDPLVAVGQSPQAPEGKGLATEGPEVFPPSGLPQASSGVLPASQASSDGTPSAGRILGLLRRAVQTKDNQALKDCLDELVALGDGAVDLLGEMIARGNDEACIWAAEALARIGTPAATSCLLDRLSQMEDGAYKEEIAKRAAKITNHDSWPVLLDAIETAQDAAVRRAASVSLSRMADAPIVDELVAQYDAADTTDEATYLAQTVGNISSPKAAEPLLTLARQIPSVPEDMLDQAVFDALARVGDPQCVSYLLTRLEASAPGEGAYLVNAISQINQPQAQASLLYAAAGNKEVSAELGRTAAICALRNFPNEQTYVLLEQIVSSEQNAAVAAAAARTLEEIQQSQPTLASNAQVKPDEQILLQANPLQK
jgi:HEAT repeat protein